MNNVNDLVAVKECQIANVRGDDSQIYVEISPLS